MGLFSSAESESVDLDAKRQAEFEKPYSKKRATTTSYGVDKAIELMRDLPQQELGAVVGIVIHTLESMQIDVDAIIDDAEQKESRVSQRIQFLEQEIGELSGRIKKCGDEIEFYRTELAEVSAIKQLLQSDAALSGDDLQFADEPEDELALMGEETD